MKKEINIRQIQYDAEEIFRIGGFYCSEAIVSSIRKNIDPNMPEGLISAASGFPIGVGRSGCMCGAISGAVIALGYFFGKFAENSHKNMPDTVKNSQECAELVFELQESFRKNHQGTLCCHIHVEGMDLSSGEHKKQCIAFTGEMARKTAELIARELKLKVVYDDVEVR